MDAKTQRQDARRRAREARTEPDKARKEREKRTEDLAVTVLLALDAIAEQERRAGQALRVMVENEGLSLREAVGWCGNEVSLQTAARFKRLASDASGDDDIGATEADAEDLADDAGSVHATAGEKFGDKSGDKVDEEVDEVPAGNAAEADGGGAVSARL